MTADDALREEARRRADYLDAPPMYPEGYEHGFIDGTRWSRQQVARVEREAYRRGQAEAWDEGFAAFTQWHARHPIDDHKPEPTNPYREQP